ncbi:MAG: hypothetical protein ACKO0Z_00055 [Betaproteobacteria bacterium]
MTYHQSAPSGVIQYSGRRGRPQADFEGLSQAPAPKVALAKAPIVQSAALLFALSCFFQTVVLAAASAIAYAGVASLLQLVVLRRRDARFNAGRPVGSALVQLRVARWIALFLVVAFQIFTLVA